MSLEHEGIRQVDMDRVAQIARLRAVNAKLLEALEACEPALRKDGERELVVRNAGLPGVRSDGTMPHNLKLANLARAAIEEARK